MKKKLQKERKIRKDLERKNFENKVLISFYESTPSVTTCTSCSSVLTPDNSPYVIPEPVITQPTQNINQFNDFNNNCNVLDHLLNFDEIDQFSKFQDPSLDLFEFIKDIILE